MSGAQPKIKTVIVDDEELARKMLLEFLASHPEIEIVAECANGFEAVKAVTELNPDLIFLDIQMPKLNGFARIGQSCSSPPLTNTPCAHLKSMRSIIF